MRIVINKEKRRLCLLDGDTTLLCAPVALGRDPLGAKAREGDGKTPEGSYRICLVKADGKYGRSLGLSYPNTEDARAGLASGVIDEATYLAILNAQTQRRRPPWGTALGGEIYIHEGGANSDWTEGCIALNPSDMDALYPLHKYVTDVEILP
ncbi:MAG TPA: L,D-transpeptidase family protein [Candidatus Limiplasma sp.]|nr:L,D-transpeptidase family protein [Candidatus Limiplasma sp.]HRX09346.1 L,D-transpeptidase family protein [Candidatus Limiplasma sp.]